MNDNRYSKHTNWKYIQLFINKPRIEWWADRLGYDELVNYRLTMLIRRTRKNKTIKRNYDVEVMSN